MNRPGPRRPAFSRHFVALLFAWLSGLAVSLGAEETVRPNILWITSEDNGPHVGCYGDSYADTPNIDALARKGTIYLNAWSNAPVCAPARTTLISGLYPTSTGSEHMRSTTRLPAGFLMYPQYLRRLGYYCTNNSKEDYNLEKPGEVWDDSSNSAHWKNREAGQPFFAIFNHTVCHESQIRKRPHEAVHDSSAVRIPRYHPDTPEVRRDWAQYYDKLTEMDARVGANLRELEEAGLADDTIVFYYGDHGPGMPRSKRWPYNSGLHVPLIVHIPEKFGTLRTGGYRPGGTCDRLVAFIDLPPTLLSLAGERPPAHFQGGAFLGEFTAPERRYNYGFRGRMDERYDLVRTVRDDRYIYVRNYMPHKVYGQYVDYMFQTPTTRVWRELYDAGKLEPPRTYFWETKPPEELYDLKADPDEVRNLAGSKEHAAVLQRFRRAHRDFVIETRDVGFLPESEIHERAKDSTPYVMGHDPDRYPLERILAAAELASSLDAGSVPALVEQLSDEDSAIRYWAALGIRMREEGALPEAREALVRALADDSSAVRVLAAETLGLFSSREDARKALDVLADAASLERHDLYTVLLALNAIDALDARARPIAAVLKDLPRKHPSVPGRLGNYVTRLLEKTLADLSEG